MNDRLALKVPPVLVFGVALILIHLGDWWLPASAVELPYRWGVVIGCLLLSGWLGLSALFTFYRAKTTVNPISPELAATMVTHGVFRLSRNPMYLGLVLILIADVYWLGSFIGLIWIIGFVVYMTYFQIMPEERILGARFGEPYQAYLQRVRRWL
ncbi:isoprenylcysteine carboxylmethyltransferase family protein [Vibrio rhizosphaerae]|uniref:Isoprenylcysteine carboxylmethyltransferase family protein n=1 Tax=Vibrio rhizosphaerae TaxID=398736 RepID=A0ABU4IU47_9VIBR|nr:isoprenylcysteine carboxylmethyltransferase family protein [Vibrio rhizosphaerae]MDW6092804.1 isoprenylcysteine carboxylmethyltransferase family protein [Vibrio rhizosphaerae]